MQSIDNTSENCNISSLIDEQNQSFRDTQLPMLPLTTLFSNYRLVYGVIIPIIVVIGYLGNVFTAIVLWSKEMASPTNLLLRALVVSDIVLITGAFFLFPGLINDQNEQSDAIWPQGAGIAHFYMLTSQLINVYVIISVPVERYVAICNVLKCANLHSRRKIMASIYCICVFSILYNLPRVFAYECCNGHSIVTLTDFGTSYFYETIYSVWMYSIVYFVIPLTVLVCLNIMIVRELKRMNNRREHLGTEMREKINITKSVVLIVSVFTFVQTLGFINQLHYYIFDFEFGFYFVLIVSCMFVLNSSINFLIYIVVGRKFRQKFVSLFSKCSFKTF